MAKKKKQQNIPGIVITVIAALLAIAAVVFLVITLSDREGGGQPAITTEDPGFVPTDELISETEQAAYELLPENYKVYQYLTLGMSVKEEPYGNLPEDGFYTCVNEKYPTFEAFSEYVRSIYISATAEKLLTDPFGKGAVYGDDNGELGLSVDFVASTEEGLSWADVNFTCTPISADECEVDVVLKDAAGKDVTKSVSMILEDGKWKLSDLIG